jgi:hypothetical protein
MFFTGGVCACAPKGDIATAVTMATTRYGKCIEIGMLSLQCVVGLKRPLEAMTEMLPAFWDGIAT